MSNFDTWFVVLVVLGALHSSSSTIEHICQNESKDIECPTGTGPIQIKSVVLTRSSRGICDNSSWFIWCPKQNVYDQVKTSCDGKNQCSLAYDGTLNAEKEADECSGPEDTRYLEVDYRCSGAPTIPPTTPPPEQNNDTFVVFEGKTKTICEFNYGSIVCPSRSKINITSIFWGRRENTEICQSNYYTNEKTRTKKCDFNNEEKREDLIQSMKEQCNGISKCTFMNPKWYLGNPCPGEEISKYLDIKYDCITDGFQVCNKDTQEVTCNNGQVIKITRAFYGHDPDIPNYCKVSKEIGKCGRDVTAQLDLICGGSRGCQVSALDDRFPSTGCGAEVKQYVDFMYKCVPYTKTAAQPTKMTFTSPGPSVAVNTKNLSAGKGSIIGCMSGPGLIIYIKSAWFGNKGLGCGIDVTENLKFQCEGGSFCGLSADQGKYGRTDCAQDVDLKLTVEYQCAQGPNGTRPPVLPPLVNIPSHDQVPPVGLNDAQCGLQSIAQSRVISGTEAKPGRWPWQVEIYTSSFTHLCGGAMITNRWLLTAAHCIGQENVATVGDKYFVVLGEFNRSKNEGHEFKYKIRRLIRHPEYDVFGSTKHDKDIALMELDRNVELTSYIRTVCIPDSPDIEYYDDCFLTGWGKPTSPGNSAYVLQQGLLKVVTNQECQRKLKTDALGEPGESITSNMICGDDKTGAGVSGCQGDSGGPFVCRRKSDNKWYLRGLVSWGSQRCSIRDMYQVLTRVSSFYRWTVNNMN